MEPVDPEDERARFRKPPPPPDRVWLHPSEVGRMAPASEERRMAPVVVATAVVASLLSGGLMMVAVGLLDRSSTPRAVEPAAVDVPAASGGSMADVIEGVRPSVAQVRVGEPPVAAGSALIFRSDGHLLTNAHLVAGAGPVLVVLQDDRELPARLVGVDGETDSAVLKVDGDGFPAAPFGSASALRVGDPALALGSALDAASAATVTSGVVSALHRRARSRGGSPVLTDLVQVDAPAAPGVAGGALVDAAGTVVGMVTAVAADEKGIEGMSFAMPIEAVRTVAEKLIAGTGAKGGWLGIHGDDLDDASADELELEGGARVAEVLAGSPAAGGGLAEHDVIVGIDGRPVTSMRHLVAELRGRRPGDRVSLGLVRGDERLTVSLVLAEKPAR